MSDKCKHCGACQHCGSRPPYFPSPYLPTIWYISQPGQYSGTVGGTYNVKTTGFFDGGGGGQPTN